MFAALRVKGLFWGNPKVPHDKSADCRAEFRKRNRKPVLELQILRLGFLKEIGVLTGNE
jgi:hypothetical protein